MVRRAPTTRRDVAIPSDLQRSIDVVAGAFDRSLRMPRGLDEMLDRLSPVIGYDPQPPSQATLNELRRRLKAVETATTERVSDAVASMLRWLLANAPRIGWRQVSFILVAVVYPLLLTIYSKEITEFCRPTTRSERRAVERKIQETAGTVAPPSELLRCRYVKVDTLNVRTAARRNSSCVASLTLGDLVREVRSTKDWTLVEHDHGDVHIRGWVFTRHLGRFKG